MNGRAEGRVLSEIAGAPYSMVQDTMSNVGGFVSGVATGDWQKAADALRAGGPIAVRNAIKGAEQLSQGYASDSKGRKVADVSTVDGLLQLTGLSSAAVSVLRALRGEWHDAAVPLGGAYFGCRARLTQVGAEQRREELHPDLYQRVSESYRKLEEFQIG